MGLCARLWGWNLLGWVLDGSVSQAMGLEPLEWVCVPGCGTGTPWVVCVPRCGIGTPQAAGVPSKEPLPLWVLLTHPGLFAPVLTSAEDFCLCLWFPGGCWQPQGCIRDL